MFQFQLICEHVRTRCYVTYHCTSTSAVRTCLAVYSSELGLTGTRVRLQVCDTRAIVLTRITVTRVKTYEQTQHV